jgi:hypothetical protein
VLQTALKDATKTAQHRTTMPTASSVAWGGAITPGTTVFAPAAGAGRGQSRVRLPRCAAESRATAAAARRTGMTENAWCVATGTVLTVATPAHLEEVDVGRGVLGARRLLYRRQAALAVAQRVTRSSCLAVKAK